MPVPVFDATGGNHGGGVSQLTWSHTCSQNAKILIVGVMASQSGTDIQSVTYNGVNLSLKLDNPPGTNLIIGEYWYLLNPASGAHDVVVTHGTTVGDLAAASCSYENVDTGNPFGDDATDTAFPFGANSDPFSVDVASGANELVVDVVAFSIGGGIAVGAGQTERNQQVEDATFGVAISEQAGTTTTNMGWDPVGDALEWILHAVALRGVQEGGPIVRNMMIG